MNRRDLLKGAGVVAGATLSGNVFAGAAASGSHSLEKHPLISSLGTCVAACELCVSHCIDMLEQGNTMFRNVLHKTRECLAICEAMLTLATFDADHRAALAKLCAEVCREC